MTHLLKLPHSLLLLLLLLLLILRLLALGMCLLLLLLLLLALLLQLVNGRLRAVGDELRFRAVVDAGPLLRCVRSAFSKVKGLFEFQKWGNY